MLIKGIGIIFILDIGLGLWEFLFLGIESGLGEFYILGMGSGF